MPSYRVNDKTKDKLHFLPPGSVRLSGEYRRKSQLVLNGILKALDYAKLVDFFRARPELFAAGEFWGKIMRAACLTHPHSGDEELKAMLDASVADLLSVQDDDGCISNFKRENQPYHSDLWERKYLLLGLEEYHAITGDERVLDAMVRLADYTLSQVGPAPKVRIVDTGWAFEGIESSSILEPIVRLYRLTGYERYLAFARYIVEEEGGCRRENLFEAAFAGKDPKDIGGNGNPQESIAKAYEMMSCFEGLADYCRVTGSQHHLQSVLNLYHKIREQEINVIGSGGAAGPWNLGPGTGEQWNRTAYEQTNPDIGRGNETCVTVTWVKFCAHVLRLTADPTVADEIERSVYNALFGALHPAGDYFEYYPGLRGTRTMEKGFGYRVGEFDLTCCSANGPTGMAMVPLLAVMGTAGGLAVNLYLPGTVTAALPGGETVQFAIETEYPLSGAIAISVDPETSAQFPLDLRIPAWSRDTALRVNGEDMAATPGTYARIDRMWSPGDRVELRLDMRCRLIDAPRGSNRAGDRHRALVRGPVALCHDRRTGEIDGAVEIHADENGCVAAEAVADSTLSSLHFRVPAGGGHIEVIDYASAGSTWDEHSAFRVWLPY